jgi:hypothetical protein
VHEKFVRQVEFDIRATYHIKKEHFISQEDDMVGKRRAQQHNSPHRVNFSYMEHEEYRTHFPRQNFPYVTITSSIPSVFKCAPEKKSECRSFSLPPVLPT